MLKAISKQAEKIVDVSFLLRYLVRFVVFYYLCKGFILVWDGVTSPGGRTYFPFCDRYLNLFEFIKTFVFKTSLFLANLFGAQAYQNSTNTLQVTGAGHLIMRMGCYGLGLMSFWIAFVSADTTSLRRKLMWGMAGIAALLVINSIRVTFLLIALKNRWNIHIWDSYSLTHHTLFNIVAYALIFLLMYVYYKRNKESLEPAKVNRIR